MTDKTLTVHWRTASDTPQTTGWHTWDNAPTAASPIDEKLGWPAGTRGVLEEAFRQKLSRFSGWDLSKLSHKEAASTAARFFKRGVPTRPLEKTPLAQKTADSYPIRSHCNEPATILQNFKNSFWVVDANVWSAWPQLKGISSSVCVLELTEKSKTLNSVAHILDAARASEHHNDPWVIIGGGILADTAAFAATLFNRPFTLVPTTLLAMVDACVGGKTGVNFPPFGKNQIGLFAFPESVEAIPQFLNTLPLREYQAGLSESLKHALLAGDHALWNRLVNQATPLNEAEISRLIAVKADVVAEDPFEHSKRAILNLGHTLGHALEGISHSQSADIADTLHHGEAVALGMYFAMILSEHMGAKEDMTPYRKDLAYAKVLVSRKTLERVLQTNLDNPYLWNEIETYLGQDKKASGNETRWVLLQGFGDVWHRGQEWTMPVPQDILLKAWHQFVKELT